MSDWSSDVCSSDLLHRLVDEHAGGLPRRHFDPPAGGRPGRGGDGRRLDRQRIGPARMAVHPFQPDRNVADGGIQFGRRRKAAQAPKLLVPARADDPLDRKSTPSELQSLMRISYAVFCLKTKKTI